MAHSEPLNPEAQAEAQVLALASAMEECVCIDGITHPDSHGDDCKGSGSVPRFEGLRDYYSSQCGKQDCSCAMDWLPVPVDVAAGKIRQMKGFQEWLIYGRDWIGLEKFVLMICDDHAVIAAAVAWAGLE